MVEGLISGRHRSPFRGQSVEFAQHRQYAPGDDLRYLDWKVWAKSDRLYVKEFEEETNLRTTLLLDASASMDYGEGEQNKFDYACRLSAALAYLMLRQSDAVGMFAFDETIRAEVPMRNQQGHLRTILQAMSVAEPAKKLDLTTQLGAIVERCTYRGLMVLVSDLLADKKSVHRGLNLLRERGHEVVVLHVLHDQELDFEFQGTTRFEGIEDPTFITCDPRGLREDYLAAMKAYLSDLRRICARTRIDYRLVRTSQPIDAVLAELLRERMRTS